MVVNLVIGLGDFVISRISHLGRFVIFLLRVFSCWPKSWPPFFKSLYRQVNILGAESIPLIFITGFFSGLVFSMQGYITLDRFGSVVMIGEYFPIAVYRELGPIIATLVFAGRSGTHVASEIAAMKANEQISCMEIMAVDPFSNILLPRFLAIIICLPLLISIFNWVAICSCYLLVILHYHIPVVGFFKNLRYVIEYDLELATTMIKSILFGLSVAWASTYFGYYAEVNAAGVGKAATRAVVGATLMILGFDVFVTGWVVPHWVYVGPGT